MNRQQNWRENHNALTFVRINSRKLPVDTELVCLSILNWWMGGSPSVLSHCGPRIERNGQIKVSEVRGHGLRTFSERRHASNQEKSRAKKKRSDDQTHATYLWLHAMVYLLLECRLFFLYLVCVPDWPTNDLVFFLSALDFLVKEVERGCRVGFPGILLSTSLESMYVQPKTHGLCLLPFFVAQSCWNDRAWKEREKKEIRTESFHRCTKKERKRESERERNVGLWSLLLFLHSYYHALHLSPPFTPCTLHPCQNPETPIGLMPPIKTKISGCIFVVFWVDVLFGLLRSCVWFLARRERGSVCYPPGVDAIKRWLFGILIESRQCLLSRLDREGKQVIKNRGDAIGNWKMKWQRERYTIIR